MIAGRDSRGRFIKGNVPTALVVRRVGGGAALKLVRVGPKVISEGVLKPERVQVICPACGQQVVAVARDGRVKGYCAVGKQSVDFAVKGLSPFKDKKRGRGFEPPTL